MPANNDDPGFMWLLFSPSGRIGRQPYVMSILLWLTLQGVAVSQMLANEHFDGGLLFWTLALVITSLATFVSLIMLSIKRVHDMGYPAIFAFLLFIPVVSFVAAIAFFFWPSAPPNDFGEFTNRPK
ncbi:MAG: Conserved hypothetical transrane protein [Rhizobium sp.]|nr:Conserved hypothetical transrane protein [Rhizobium sp.]